MVANCITYTYLIIDRICFSEYMDGVFALDVVRSIKAVLDLRVLASLLRGIEEPLAVQSLRHAMS